MDPVRLGLFLSARLKQVGMSQGELARRLGLGRSTISNWAAGRNAPDRSLLVPLSVELGMTMDELMQAAGAVPFDRQSVVDVDPEMEAPPPGTLTLILSNQARILRELGDMKNSLDAIQGAVYRLEERDRSNGSSSNGGGKSPSTHSCEVAYPSQVISMLKAWVEHHGDLLDADSLSDFQAQLSRLYQLGEELRKTC